MESPRSPRWLLILMFMQSCMLLYDCFFSDNSSNPFFFITSLILGSAGLVVAVSLFLPKMARAQARESSFSEEVQDERRRIASELHDTLGFQLLQAMALLEVKPPQERHPAQELLEQSLFDLRLIVDTMDAPDDNLAMQMAKLRHRLAPALARKGLTLHWSVRDPELEMGPSTATPLPRGKVAHQILKVFQESISNAVRHSGTSDIWVTLEPYSQQNQQGSDWDWCLRIEDCGFGFDLQAVLEDDSRSGQGVKNMFRRIANIGGDLCITQKSEGGTQILVRWRSQDCKE